MNSFLVLIVEDDDNLREAIKETLSLENIVSVTARNGKEALVLLNSRSVDLILSDIQMPELDGIGLLKAVSQKFFRLPIVLMTAYGDIQNAVEAMRLGAADYLVKPFEIKALLDLINQFSVYATSTDPMVASPNSIDLLNRAKHVAKNDATVMITGESGTGKEVLARYIHQYSSRAQKDFVAINCAAIPENMLEAVLFGYEKGAFTGAYQTTPGKFELANGGTILLDEISEMDLTLQAKLLRVLQEREIDRLGAKKTIPIDVRVIATSNRNLLNAVKENKFREDLYYSLNVIPLSWPALRDRKQDIIPIAEFLLEKHAMKMQKKVPVISDLAKEKLLSHSWPGNVRELENSIQRALVFQSGDTVCEHDFSFSEILGIQNNDGMDNEDLECLNSDIKKHEYKLISKTLKECRGNRKLMAEKLGISPRTLRYKLAKMREEGLDTIY